MNPRILILPLLAALSLSLHPPQAPVPANPTLPRHELRLSLLEYSVLHGAAVSGVSKYGGDIDFQVKLAKVGEELITTVTISQPRLIEVWSYYMAERTAEFVGQVNLDQLDEEATLALKTAQSLNAKLAAARSNPIWDPIELSGSLAKEEDALYIQSERGRFKVTGSKAPELDPLAGREVIAAGFNKVRDELEITSFVERKPNTLELAVMSYCPFAKQAEHSLIRYLRDWAAPSERPRMELRYVFYRRPPEQEGGEPSFWCMHGEKELEENLVQMAIRDLYPDALFDYLLLRAARDAPWRDLAGEVGLDPGALSVIEEWIASERATAIQAEYDYLAGKHGILDGSPKYIWEGRKVADIRRVGVFETLEFSSPTCAQAK